MGRPEAGIVTRVRTQQNELLLSPLFKYFANVHRTDMLASLHLGSEFLKFVFHSFFFQPAIAAVAQFLKKTFEVLLSPSWLSFASDVTLRVCEFIKSLDIKLIVRQIGANLFFHKLSE